MDDTYRGYSELERMAGNFNQALHFLREAAQWSRSDLSAPAYQVRLGKIYLTMEQIDLAKKSLEAAVAQLKESPASEERAAARFLLAVIAQKQKNLDRAGELMRCALEDVALLGYDQFMVVLAREHEKHVLDILAAEENRFLREISRKMSEEPLSYTQLVEKPKEEAAVPQVKLAIKTLGMEEVRINGASIPSSRWKSARARALFFYILDKEHVTKQQISLEFWPDFSQSKVNSNFHATLWRVRNALGVKEIIGYDDNTYYLDNYSEIIYDVALFTRLVEKFDQLTDNMTERRNIGYQILDIYRDDFLIDVDMEWANIRRTELRSMFTSCLEELANTEAALGHFENARNLYQQLIDADPFIEEYHVGLASALIKMGSHIAAKKHLLEYKAFLLRELKVLPSEDLEDLYSSL
ncbi:MAG: BTAD domain-containing putative transcriptional regulator [Anaerolineales bacterium]